MIWNFEAQMDNFWCTLVHHGDIDVMFNYLIISLIISFSTFYNSVRLCCLLDFSLTKKLLGNQTVPSNFDLLSGWWYYFSHPKKSPLPYCAASVIYHQNWPSIFSAWLHLISSIFDCEVLAPKSFMWVVKKRQISFAMKLWGFFIVYEE